MMSYTFNNTHYYKKIHQNISGYVNIFRGSWTPFNWVEKYNYAFNGPSDKGWLALTFDDGPDPDFTPAILDKLKKYDVKATFFLLGNNIEKYPEIAKRIAEEGHVIGNHTYSHPNLTQVSDEVYHDEIKKADELIKKYAGYYPRFFRPTYGAINENQVAWATNEKMMIIQWSVDTLDWEGKSAEEISRTVAGNALPGGIILQHNASGVPLQGSVEALDLIIPQMKNKGVTFVTLAEMFNKSANR